MQKNPNVEPSAAFGTSVSITGDTLYEFPSDGYVWLYSKYGSTNYLYVNIYGSNNAPVSVQVVAAAHAAAAQLVYVRKGMKIQKTNVSGDYYITFIPFA